MYEWQHKINKSESQHSQYYICSNICCDKQLLWKSLFQVLKVNRNFLCFPLLKGSPGLNAQATGRAELIEYDTFIQWHRAPTRQSCSWWFHSTNTLETSFGCLLDLLSTAEYFQCKNNRKLKTIHFLHIYLHRTQ